MSDSQSIGLDQYWDALIEGKPADQGSLEPDVVEAISRFHTAGDVAGPDPAFAEALWQQLRAPSSTGINATAEASLLTPNRTEPIGLYSVDFNARRSRKPVSIAAAIVLLIGGLLLASEYVDRSDSGQLSSAPTILAPATPAGPVRTEETLLTFTIAAADLPDRVDVSTGLTIDIIPAGIRSEWVPYCCEGPHIEYVLSGTYSVTFESQIAAIRSNGSEEIVPAGTEVTLRAGDALISRNEVPMEAANTGDEPVNLLHWLLLNDGGEFSGHFLPGWKATSFLDVQRPVSLELTDTVVQLRRYYVLDGDTFPVAEDGHRLIIEGDEAISLRRPLNEPITVLGDPDKALPIYIVEITQVTLPGSTPLASPVFGSPASPASTSAQTESTPVAVLNDSG